MLREQGQLTQQNPNLMQVCKFINSTCCPAPNTAFSGMQPPPDEHDPAHDHEQDLGPEKAQGWWKVWALLLPCSPTAASPHQAQDSSLPHPGLSSALWGPCLRCSVTQGLLCKFLLSTLDLIAAINTNYASLSVKLRRTRLRGSSSIQSWRTNRTAIFNPGNVSREPAAWHHMCLSLLLQMEFFTFQRNIFCFQLEVYEGGKSLRDVNT